ncbi:MAG: class I adenylate-forming enzyme family protein [Oscillospiraceae bacterium]
MLGVYNWFAEIAQNNKENIAVVHNGERTTYAQLHAEINRLAWGLHQSGICIGSRVAFMLSNSKSFIVAFYALQKLGAFAMPINFRLNANEIHDYIEIAGCTCFIYGNEFENTVLQAAASCPHLRLVCANGTGEDTFERLSNNGYFDWEYYADTSNDAEVLALMTGGTTGRSKAAVHTKYGLLNQIMSRCIEDDYKCDLRYHHKVSMIAIPMFHIGGLSLLLDTVVRAGTVVLTSEFRCEKLMKLISEEKVTTMLLVPPSLAHEVAKRPDVGNYDFSSVYMIGLGGSKIDPLALEEVYRVFPNAIVRMAYTNSEYSCGMNLLLDREQVKKHPELVNSVGKPYMFCEARIINDEGREAAPGEVGELWGKSMGMLSRYIDGSGEFYGNWLATGDLMYQDEQGYYYFVDRKKDMIKCGGENIYSIEVESAILEHPAVSECAVVGLPDPFYSEIVAAVVVLKDGARLGEQELIEFCKTRIASYKKPRKVFFAAALPRSGVGKVQKYKLKQMLFEERRL